MLNEEEQGANPEKYDRDNYGYGNYGNQNNHSQDYGNQYNYKNQDEEYERKMKHLRGGEEVEMNRVDLGLAQYTGEDEELVSS